MSYADFLHAVIETGIAGARADYTGPANERKLAGSIAGFELCRGQSPELLVLTLMAAEQDLHRNRQNGISPAEYWFWNCRAVEVEWVCNVVSAALRLPLRPYLPTVRAVLHASKILGASTIDVN